SDSDDEYHYCEYSRPNSAHAHPPCIYIVVIEAGKKTRTVTGSAATRRRSRYLTMLCDARQALLHELAPHRVQPPCTGSMAPPSDWPVAMLPEVVREHIEGHATLTLAGGAG